MSEGKKEDKSPLVSICIITYNHEKYIQQAVDSILSQKLDFTYEVLIADDASTDRTQQILKENYSNIDNVRLILREKNVGINGYMTYQEAKGKYIYLCEGDDYCLGEDSIQTLVDWLERHEEYAGVCGRRITLSEKTGFTYIGYDRKSDNKDIALDDILANRFMIDMCAILYRNFYFDGKYDYRYYLVSRKVSDLTRAIYVLLHGKVFQSDKVVGVYRTDQIRTSCSYNVMNTPAMKLEEHMNILLNFDKFIGQKLDYSGLKKRYISWYVSSCYSTYDFVTKIPYLLRKVGIKITIETIKMWIKVI